MRNSGASRHLLQPGTLPRRLPDSLPQHSRQRYLRLLCVLLNACVLPEVTAVSPDAPREPAGQSVSGDRAAPSTSPEIPDAGADGSKAHEGEVARGQPCDSGAAFACTRPGPVPLVCADGVWMPGPSCAQGAQCEAGFEPTPGDCLDLLNACGALTTELTYCDGQRLVQCNPDRNTLVASVCPDGLHCETSSCVDTDECEVDNGGCGDAQHWTCVNRVGQAPECKELDSCSDPKDSCDKSCRSTAGASATCSSSGSSACDGDTVCDEAYPCALNDSESGYICAGLLPDWEVSRGSQYSVLDGVVADMNTGLQWQRDFESGNKNWSDAESYCSALELDGGGWRLPYRSELESLLEFDSLDGDHIDVAAFPRVPHDGGPASYFWTRSPVTESSRMWQVQFSTPSASRFYDRPARISVRCVRRL